MQCSYKKFVSTGFPLFPFRAPLLHPGPLRVGCGLLPLDAEESSCSNNFDCGF